MTACEETTNQIANMLFLLPFVPSSQKSHQKKTLLDTMLKLGKELKTVVIRHNNLKKFCKETKQYDTIYSVLKKKNNTVVYITTWFVPKIYQKSFESSINTLSQLLITSLPYIEIMHVFLYPYYS